MPAATKTKFNQMTDNERIDFVLRHIVDRDPEVITISDLLHAAKDDDKYAYARISGIMQECSLANVLDSNRVQANGNSRNIIKMGGYLEYLKQKTEKENETSELEKLNIKKLKYDIMLAKWQVKAFWPAFVIAVIGGFYTFYVIISLAIGESEEQRLQRIIENKIQEIQQKNKTLLPPIAKDTLSILKH